MGDVRINNLTISYSGTPVIEDLSLEINDGEIISLLGPSGAGKTTILKAIAGLIHPQGGEIYLAGKRADHLPAEERDAVLIFQKPLLFPFLSVEANIGFGLKMAKVDKILARQKIAKIINITGLTGLETRKIHQLSGGQQQRVALARGLVLEPSILLLDEPLSNLDTELRHQMRELIRDIQRQTGITMLFVTHDQSEAFALSDRVCLLLDGQLQQTGSPLELFYEPANPRVARFFGCTNFFTGTIHKGIFTNGFLTFEVLQDDGEKRMAAIRPEAIEISMSPKDQAIQGKIVSQQFEGSTSRFEVLIGKTRVHVVSMHPAFRIGQKVWLTFPAKHFRLFTP